MKKLCIILLAITTGCGLLPPRAPSECPVHHLPLEHELAHSRLGAPRFEYEKAHDQFFPYSGTRFSNNFRSDPEYSQLLVCPECRRLEQVWIRENRWK